MNNCKADSFRSGTLNAITLSTPQARVAVGFALLFFSTWFLPGRLPGR
jgi:hypothetical protein